MSNLINLDQVREELSPHLCIKTLDGNVHAIPVATIQNVISGNLELTKIDDWEIIVRTILKDWLEMLTVVPPPQREEEEKPKYAEYVKPTWD